MQTIENNALVLRVDGDLDARAGNKIRRAPTRLRRTMRTEAIVDLRSTRRATSEGWGALVSAVRSITWTGGIVTVLMHSGLQALAELSGLARHARVVVFD
jgi:anti-anti-sigma factor